MPTLNLGIVAHVDAGKTTLTERLLFEAGVTTHIGRVDHGDTVTDADAIERRRGITIRSAVVAFTVGGVKINLIDTPGHSDFVAEVERALAVLDGAVLVVSAVEGIQAQTRVLIRILERLSIPFLVFVNKIDRVGASYGETMTAIRDAITGDALAVTEPVNPGSRAATVVVRSGPEFLDDLVERLTEYDDELLRQYVDNASALTERAGLDVLQRLSVDGTLHPVYFGSALSGTGISEVLDGLTRYLPATVPPADERLHASVFKIERNPVGHKVGYVRLHAGTLAARDDIVHHSRSAAGAMTVRTARASGVHTFSIGSSTTSTPAHAGDIAKIVGLADLEIGDQLGRWDPVRSGRLFAPPGLEAVVRPRSPGDRQPLFDALRQLGEQDPLIDVRLDGIDQELTVSLYGEVQREVLVARLATEYGVEAEFLPTRTVYIERVAGVGRALKVIGTPGNPDLATVGMRIEPAPAGSGVTYQREVQLGGLLLSFHTAIEETILPTLDRGLSGWRVTDCVVSLTHSGYWAPTSAAGDFRRLTAIVLREALANAGTTVCAPVSEFELEIPASALSSVLHKLHASAATVRAPQMRTRRCRITGLLPTDQVQAFEQRLPGLTSGQGYFFSHPAGYQPVHGPPPVRTRRGDG
jgi:ribosomal protection tetracycline resistance protein